MPTLGMRSSVNQKVGVTLPQPIYLTRSYFILTNLYPKAILSSGFITKGKFSYPDVSSRNPYQSK